MDISELVINKLKAITIADQIKESANEPIVVVKEQPMVVHVPVKKSGLLFPVMVLFSIFAVYAGMFYFFMGNKNDTVLKQQPAPVQVAPDYTNKFKEIDASFDRVHEKMRVMGTIINNNVIAESKGSKERLAITRDWKMNGMPNFLELDEADRKALEKLVKDD